MCAVSTAAEAQPVTLAKANGTFGAWVIRASFKASALYDDLDEGVLEYDWALPPNPTYRHGLMAVGDPVLFYASQSTKWSHPNGVYAFGMVSGPVYRGRVPDDQDMSHWTDEAHARRERDWVPIALDVFDEPITLGEIKAIDTLAQSELVSAPRMTPAYLTTAELARFVSEFFVEDYEAQAEAEAVDALERASEPERADPELNARIEKAATDAVVQHFEALNYQHTDVALDKVGWDSTFTKAGHPDVHVEIKGRKSDTPTVVITANEIERARDTAGWVLAVVTNALDRPTLAFYSADDVIAAAAPTHYRAPLTTSPGRPMH